MQRKKKKRVETLFGAACVDSDFPRWNVDVTHSNAGPMKHSRSESDWMHQSWVIKEKRKKLTEGKIQRQINSVALSACFMIILPLLYHCHLSDFIKVFWNDCTKTPATTYWHIKMKNFNHLSFYDYFLRVRWVCVRDSILSEKRTVVSSSLLLV